MEVTVRVVNLRHRYRVTFRRLHTWQPMAGPPKTRPVFTGTEEVEVLAASADRAREIVENTVVPGQLLRVEGVEFARDESDEQVTTHRLSG